jgi:hypothetical protein
MAPPSFESGFIATIVLLAVAVAVIAMLAGLGSYGPPKPKPTPEPAPPATLASLARRAPPAAVANMTRFRLGSADVYSSFKRQVDLDASAYQRVLVNASSVIAFMNSKTDTEVLVYLRVYKVDKNGTATMKVAEFPSAYKYLPSAWDTVTPLLQVVVDNPGKLRVEVDVEPSGGPISIQDGLLNISATAA